MTRENKLVLNIVIATYLITNGIFLIPGLPGELICANVDLTINGQHRAFHVPHSLVAPLLLTLVIWPLAYWMAHTKTDHMGSNRAAWTMFLRYLGMILGVAFTILFLLLFDFRLLFDFFYGLARGLQDIMRYTTIAGLILVGIYALWFTWRKKWACPYQDV